MWDKQNLFSDGQAVAAANSDNIIDAGPGDAGKSDVVMVASVSKGVSGNLAIALATAAAATSTALTSPKTIAVYTIPADRLAKGGDILKTFLPTGCKRFLRLGYSGASGGTITAGINKGPQTNGMP